MAFGVFIHRFDSIYRDTPAERYHFPRQYLRRVEACVGDWIVYYEPRKVLRTRGYFAVARVQEVVPDPGSDDMFYALIEPGTYLDFVEHVAFNLPGGGLIERGLLNEAGNISGRAQAAVRPLGPADFARIIARGLPYDETFLPRVDIGDAGFQFAEEQAPYAAGSIGDRERQLVSRDYRDRMFRRVVLKAYDSRCALTGLKLVNGGGRAEVEAAHIQPVESGGPDVIGNGIALSGTIHWMFDRGLVSLSNNLDIMISRHVNDLDAVRSLLNRNGRATPPDHPSARPLPQFLEWHREHSFKS
ncbi:HNH endonuclease [Jiella avicenniae]|uniref:HNH endonuclease n=1 Tax=Jiella avicenniae TaxID=2907202 RepID=A0A9X1P041_9HYPH|nr:HNH endonuclease [Jiella avicenniae]MCE7027571.1 HNH endonuclease [Jiella avicenniae]